MVILVSTTQTSISSRHVLGKPTVMPLPGAHKHSARALTGTETTMLIMMTSSALRKGWVQELSATGSLDVQTLMEMDW